MAPRAGATSTAAVYLDHNATTPIAPEVVDAMLPYLERHFGNPSSAHAYGAAASEAVAGARRDVATLLGCEPEHVVFTASGSEADNLAIKGVALARRGDGDHIITSAIEHPAVLAACRYLNDRLGYRLTILPVDEWGLVDPDDVRRAIEPGTVLVTVMHANNEVGTLEPIAEIARIARERGITFHTDASQSVSKIPVDVEQLGVDLLTVTGHKMYAPKGVGALYVRPGTRLDSLIHGGRQEYGLRGGTENVPYVVGLGAACALAATRLRGLEHPAPARPAPHGASVRRARAAAQRASRSAPAEHPQRQLPGLRRRGAARPHALGGRRDGIRVPLRANRAVAGPDRHGA
jgi:cysteine desulfurase